MDPTRSWKESVELKMFWQMIGKHHSGFSNLFSPAPYSSRQRDIGQELQLGRQMGIIIIKDIRVPGAF